MIRTIIVDDELLAGVGVQSLIDGVDGIKVDGVFSAPEEALDYLRENMADIVITDIEMADMNGLEFIQIIRERHLADGVIILSCHDDFSYAQQAISKGTDSYLLKHSISRDTLVAELKKVYQKTHREQSGTPKLPQARSSQHCMAGRELYVIGVVRLIVGAEGQVDSTMLVHLLESVAARYDMGTVFSPYNREIFIMFQFQQDTPPTERRETLRENLNIICSNLQQYISSGICYGVSRDFTDLKQAEERYNEAVAALDRRFYEPETTIFYYREPLAAPEQARLSGEDLLEADGVEQLEQQLDSRLQNACLCQMPSRQLKRQLGQEVSRMTDRLLQSHHFSSELAQTWGGSAFSPAIDQAEDVRALREQLTTALERFREDCLKELSDDALSGVLDYIEENLAEKLSLWSLAELACMSVPSFSKKFKERTGMTLVQYLNDRRIRRVMQLLQDRNCTLDEIAEKTGFSNANYLIRVFKKVTGQTISEYRK